jgi:YD repeat-containing protein
MTSKELAHRKQDGLEVTLLWDEASNRVTIELTDERTETAFAFLVDPACALDAFYHPFPYAAVLGAEFHEAPALAAMAEESCP